MKKAIVLVLALVLTLSLAVPAAAVTSPAANDTSGTATAPLPEIVEIDVVVDVETETKTDDDTVIIVESVTAEDAGKLSEKAQTAYAAAQGQLTEAKPADMKTQYFFYVTIVTLTLFHPSAPVQNTLLTLSYTTILAAFLSYLLRAVRQGQIQHPDSEE